MEKLGTLHHRHEQLREIVEALDVGKNICEKMFLFCICFRKKNLIEKNLKILESNKTIYSIVLLRLNEVLVRFDRSEQL